MPDLFLIDCSTKTVSLDANLSGKVYFAITNISDRTIRGRFVLRSNDRNVIQWLLLEGEAEADYGIRSSRLHLVHIRVPLNQAAGTYTFYVEVIDVDTPDEDVTEGPEVSFKVQYLAPAARPHFELPSVRPSPPPASAPREVPRLDRPTQQASAPPPSPMAPSPSPVSSAPDSVDLPAFSRDRERRAGAAPASQREVTKGPSPSAAERIRSLFRRKEAALIEEKIRLDLAAPDGPVIVGNWFDVAVAIRQPGSALLQVSGLDKVISGIGSVFRRGGSDLVQYLVEISAPDCDVSTPEYTFQLKAGTDSEPRFFQLRPKKPGTHSIIVTAYQKDMLQIAQARVVLDVTIHAMALQRSRSVQTFMAAGAAGKTLPTAAVITDLPSPPKEKQVALYDALKGYAFTLEDLKDLCFRLGVDWENLAGDEKAAKARSLVRYFTSRGEFVRLYARVKMERPNLRLA